MLSIVVAELLRDVNGAVCGQAGLHRVVELPEPGPRGRGDGGPGLGRAAMAPSRVYLASIGVAFSSHCFC